MLVFFELVVEYIEEGGALPTCPDGSGDLWWDDASYIRYQSYCGPEYYPEHIQEVATTPDFCDGVANALNYGAALCDKCRAEYDAQTPPF